MRYKIISRTLILITVTLTLTLCFNNLSFAVCQQTAPNQFECNSLPPVPDPDGVQQGGNNNGVQVHVLPGGNVDTSNAGGGSGNVIAIDLGNGADHVDIRNATVVGEDQAVDTNDGPDEATVHNSTLRGMSFTLDLRGGNDNAQVYNSTLTATNGGFTLNPGDGNDTAHVDRSVITSTGGFTINMGDGNDTAHVDRSVITSTTESFTINMGDGVDDLTIKNSTITAGGTTVTVNMGDENDTAFIERSTITIADNDFPLRGGNGDDEITLSTGANIPGGIDCDFDTDLGGFDTLIFAMLVPPNQIASLSEAIENLPTPEGSITINGIFYEYRNCDVIEAELGIVEPIPTLSEWGLIAMAGILGIFGLLAIRRKATA